MIKMIQKDFKGFRFYSYPYEIIKNLSDIIRLILKCYVQFGKIQILTITNSNRDFRGRFASFVYNCLKSTVQIRVPDH